MQKGRFLAIVLLLALVSRAGPPATRPPSATSPAIDVTSLIAQLNHPDFRQREQAARALIAMGGDALPVLEKTSTAASFETTTALREIVRTIRESLRGILILEVLPGSQAEKLGIRAGDLLTRVEDRPITTYETNSAYLRQLESRRRRLVVLQGKALHEFTVEPGAIGISLMDYDARYAQALVAAVDAFRDRRMPEAREQFALAEKSGWICDDRNDLAGKRLVAVYLSGEVAPAEQMIDRWIEGAASDQQWRIRYEVLRKEYFCAAHLCLYSIRKFKAALPSETGMDSDLNWYLTMANRHPESIVANLKALEAGDPGDEYAELICLNNLHRAATLLGLKRDAREILARIGRNEKRGYIWPHLMTHECDQFELALSVCLDAWDHQKAHIGRISRAAASIIYCNMMLDRPQDALAFIKAIKPSERAAALVWLAGGEFRWPEARLVMAELVRMGLRSERITQPALLSAFGVLSWQKDPDAGELQSILDRYATAPPDEEDTHRRLRLTDAAEPAIVRGDHAAARELLSRARAAGEADADPHFEAIEFLESHAAQLHGEQEKWRQTCEAYTLENGSMVLLTREDHVGFLAAGSQAIREIPPPEKRWQPTGMNTLYRTPDRKTILTSSDRTLFRLNANADGWVKVARMPGYPLFCAGTFVRAFPQLLPHLHGSADAIGEVAWPIFPDYGHNLDDYLSDRYALGSLLLADGTWLSMDRKSGDVWLPRNLSEAALGTPVDIYEVIPADATAQKAILLTSQGLLAWWPHAGRVERLRLPDESKPQAVVPTREGLPPGKGMIRFALMPRDGGTTYTIDLTTNRIRYEGLINESMPLTYWLQMPLKAKTDIISAAMREARVDWPWKKSSELLQ